MILCQITSQLRRNDSYSIQLTSADFEHGRLNVDSFIRTNRLFTVEQSVVLYFAALIARGVCHELLEHCVLRHTLLTSDFILEETQEKLIEKFGYSAELAAETVTVLRSRMKVVPALKLDSPVCRDPDGEHIHASSFSRGMGLCAHPVAARRRRKSSKGLKK